MDLHQVDGRGRAKVFVMSPSLETVLGIGRRPPDKPRRVVEALSRRPIEEYPEPLVRAVSELFSEPQSDAQV